MYEQIIFSHIFHSIPVNFPCRLRECEREKLKYARLVLVHETLKGKIIRLRVKIKKNPNKPSFSNETTRKSINTSDILTIKIKKKSFFHSLFEHFTGKLYFSFSFPIFFIKFQANLKDIFNGFLKDKTNY